MFGSFMGCNGGGRCRKGHQIIAASLKNTESRDAAAESAMDLRSAMRTMSRVIRVRGAPIVRVMKRIVEVKKCCKDCIFFYQTETGNRGGVKGKCRIRRPNEKRAGSRVSCRFFKENKELKERGLK